jgi:rhamnosyltransferase
VSGLRVSVVLPTLDGAATLPRLLDALARARGRHPLEIIAIDSGSRDDSVRLLENAGARVLDLGGEQFGHASARNRAAAHATGAVLLFVTQDVEPVGESWLEPLLAALEEPNVAGAFGRQVPRGASPEEAFLAGANYGAAPRRITQTDLARPFGPGRTFFSSAFGLVRRAVWEKIPFPRIVMSEDQAWGMAALRAGHEVRYVPEAAVYHGHAFTLGRAFRRNFDSGASLAQLGVTGGMWGAGLAHLLRELRWIAREHGWARIPYTLLYETVRMIAFQCGRMERVIPRGMARVLGEAPRR